MRHLYFGKPLWFLSVTLLLMLAVLASSIMGHVWGSLILIATSLLVAYVAVMIEGRSFNYAPVVITLSWLTSAGIANLRLSSLQSSWAPMMWVCVLGTYLMFVGGWVWVEHKSGHNPLLVLSKSEFQKRFDISGLKKLTICLYTICTISLVVEMVKDGVPLFSHSTSSYRQFGIHYLHYLTVTLIGVCLLLGIYTAIKQKFELWAIVLFCVSVISFVLIMSRNDVIEAIFYAAMGYSLFTPSKRLRKVVFAAVPVGLILFSLMGTMRSQGSAMYILQVGGLHWDPKFGFIAWPYLYVSMGFENLNYFITNFHNVHFWGILTLQPLWAFTLLKSHIHVNIAPYLPDANFNVSTYLFPYVGDFGVLGALVLSAVSGLVASKLAQVISSRFLLIPVYVLVIFGLWFSFFANLIIFPPQIFIAAVACMILYLSKRRYVER